MTDAAAIGAVLTYLLLAAVFVSIRERVSRALDEAARLDSPPPTGPDSQ